MLHSRTIPLLMKFYPFMLAAIALEVAFYLFFETRPYPWREMLATVGVAVLRLHGRLLSRLLIVPVAMFVWSHRLLTVPPDTWWGLVLLFVCEEFVYYWAHRAGHEIRWTWASDSMHHTPERLHLASAFRLGVTEVVSGHWLFYLPLYLFGFSPVAVAEMVTINLFYQFWLHTDLAGPLGPLEWVLDRTILGRALANAEASLSAKDAATFRAVIGRDAPHYVPVLRQLREARQQVQRDVTADPFDPAVVRQALATWQTDWDQFIGAFSDTLVDALGQISPEGRRRLVAERRLARAELRVPDRDTVPGRSMIAYPCAKTQPPWSIGRNASAAGTVRRRM